MAGITWWTVPRIAFVRDLAAEGRTAGEIAAAVRRRWRHTVGPSGIRYVCGRHGIPLRRGRADAKARRRPTS